MKLVLCFCLAATLAAAEGPRVFYSRSFPGSVPPYVEVTVQPDGSAVFKEAPDDEQPVEFQLRRVEVDEIFALSEKLDWFSRPLESELKVANMGEKTFRYTNGDESNEVKFNFSEDLDARLLADWFSRIMRTEQHFLDLERTVRFDKLGVNKVLLQIQVSIERSRLVAYTQFLPLLDRVVKNESYLNMARNRAADLADFIRAVDKISE